ncbi:MAG: TPM domain-containing protein [Deltaproteobacteria bacterium]|nr:TPM domain-containing protein [Deltaproteobacteria bacterium]
MFFVGRKKLFYSCCFLSAMFLWLAVFTATAAIGAEILPKSKDAINDFAGVIQPEARGRMENLAQEVLEKTGTAIVAATVETIGDNDPAQYANDLYAAWGIGKKGEDKGVLIFLAIRERKIRIETGYGVEGILPDGLTGQILDRYVVPFLKAGDYSKGMENAVIAVADVIAKDAGVSITGMPTIDHQGSRRQDGPSSLVPTILLLLAMGFLLGTKQGRAMLPYILLMLMSGGGRRGGGDFGGFGGGFGGFGGGMSGGGGAGRGF